MSVPKLFAWLAAAAMVLPPVAGAQQTVYKWTDKDGRTVFSDTPPPKDASGVSQKRVGGGFVDQSQLPYATQVAMKKNPVTLFIGSDCGDPCAQGRNLLSKRGIPFSERDAQGSAADSEALKKLIGTLDVPTLVVGDNKVKGFEEGQWQSALDGAGYPRTALPGQAAQKAPEPRKSEPPAAEPPPATQVPTEPRAVPYK